LRSADGDFGREAVLSIIVNPPGFKDNIAGKLTGSSRHYFFTYAIQEPPIARISESSHVFTRSVNPSRETPIALNENRRLVSLEASIVETAMTMSGFVSKGFGNVGSIRDVRMNEGR
jgi:hypothetical protein